MWTQRSRAEQNMNMNCVFCGKIWYGAPAVRGSFALFHPCSTIRLLNCVCASRHQSICCLFRWFIVRICVRLILFLFQCTVFSSNYLIHFFLKYKLWFEIKFGSEISHLCPQFHFQIRRKNENFQTQKCYIVREIKKKYLTFDRWI